MLLAALALGGCAASENGSVEGPVTVYVSLPLTGPRADAGRDAADGARLALDDAEGRAGELEVRAEYLDDARGAAWDPVAVGQNARRATEDSSTAAYIGELDSEPTRASVPITNEAGIAQISPGAGAVDLTRPAAGYEDSPDRYRPTGDPSFVRVIPADDVLARGASELVQRLDAERVELDFENTPHGRLTEEELSTDAAEIGLEVVARGGDAVLAGGAEEGLRLRPTRGRGGLEGEGEVAAALDPARLPDPDFAADFERTYDRPPGPYAAYGYEAMELALAAIADAAGADQDFRGGVVDAVLGAERPDSILGRYSITEEGDSTLCAVQPYAGGGGERRPEAPLCPGG